MRPPCPGAPLLPLCFLQLRDSYLRTRLLLPLQSSSPSFPELVLPGEVGELRGSGSPAPRGDLEGGSWHSETHLKTKWALTNSGKVCGRCRRVSTTCLVGTGEEVTQPLGWRSQQGAADQCTQSDWCLAGACFCSLTSFTPGIRCWRWEKTSWHLALLLHHPIATAGCFKPVWSLAWLKVETGTDVFVVCRSCTFWGWRGPPQSELVPSVAPS